MSYAKPLPVITTTNAPYWNAAKNHELKLPRCRECAAWVYPIARMCQACWSEDLEWAQMSGFGRVSSWVVYHRAFHPAWLDEVPYAVVQVDLDEGIRLISNLVDVPPEEIVEGLPVMVAFDDVTPDVTLVKFCRDDRSRRRDNRS